jgi:hypothetical protein
MYSRHTGHSISFKMTASVFAILVSFDQLLNPRIWKENYNIMKTCFSVDMSVGNVIKQWCQDDVSCVFLMVSMKCEHRKSLLLTLLYFTLRYFTYSLTHSLTHSLHVSGHYLKS